MVAIPERKCDASTWPRLSSVGLEGGLYFLTFEQQCCFSSRSALLRYAMTRESDQVEEGVCLCREKLRFSASVCWYF